MSWVYAGDELYGYMTLAKDWKDGVLSIIMRGMSKNFSDQVSLLLPSFSPLKDQMFHTRFRTLFYIANMIVACVLQWLPNRSN